MIFDIKDFYPSIREKLLIDSPNFAEKYTNIKSCKEILIVQWRRYMNKTPKLFVLRNHGSIWRSRGMRISW